MFSPLKTFTWQRRWWRWWIYFTLIPAPRHLRTNHWITNPKIQCPDLPLFIVLYLLLLFYLSSDDYKQYFTNETLKLRNRHILWTWICYIYLRNDFLTFNNFILFRPKSMLLYTFRRISQPVLFDFVQNTFAQYAVPGRAIEFGRRVKTSSIAF